jgi:hypothetical protein
MVTGAPTVKNLPLQLTTFNLDLEAAMILGKTWLPAAFVAITIKVTGPSLRWVGLWA